MGYHTWTVKVSDRQINIKAAKDDALAAGEVLVLAPPKMASSPPGELLLQACMDLASILSQISRCAINASSRSGTLALASSSCSRVLPVSVC